MIIDCNDCLMQNTSACDDCIVTVLLQLDRREDSPLELDRSEADALDHLADAGLVPRLRLIPKPRSQPVAPGAAPENPVSEGAGSGNPQSPVSEKPLSESPGSQSPLSKNTVSESLKPDGAGFGIDEQHRGGSPTDGAEADTASGGHRRIAGSG